MCVRLGGRQSLGGAPVRKDRNSGMRTSRRRAAVRVVATLLATGLLFSLAFSGAFGDRAIDRGYEYCGGSVPSGSYPICGDPPPESRDVPANSPFTVGG